MFNLNPWNGGLGGYNGFVNNAAAGCQPWGGGWAQPAYSNFQMVDNRPIPAPIHIHDPKRRHRTPQVYRAGRKYERR